MEETTIYPAAQTIEIAHKILMPCTTTKNRSKLMTELNDIISFRPTHKGYIMIFLTHMCPLQAGLSGRNPFWSSFGTMFFRLMFSCSVD